jgi:hypothetical protein
MCSLVHIGKENTGLLTLKRNHLARKPTRKPLPPLEFDECYKIGHPIRTLIILVQDKNTSLKLPVGVSPLQIVNSHRNLRYFVIELHTWFCLSYFLKKNIKFYCIKHITE